MDRDIGEKLQGRKRRTVRRKKDSSERKRWKGWTLEGRLGKKALQERQRQRQRQTESDRRKKRDRDR